MRLHQVTPRTSDGFVRVAHGSGFRFRTAAGRSPSARARRRAEDLAIPPAWTQVWISADPAGHIQAVGVDAAGRQQYIYHPAWTVRRDRDKFERSLILAASLPAARARVTRAVRRPGLGRERVLAAAFRLLDDSSLRIGSEQYLSRYGTRGLTTLRCGDAHCRGDTVVLRFVGKGGLPVERVLDDPDIVAALTDLVGSRSDGRLFAYRLEGRHAPVRAGDVNAYIQLVTGADITAKDFRTLHGTIVAAQSLARIGPVATGRDRQRARRQAIADAAEFLDNTPAVAQRNYVDPRIFRSYERGRVLDLRLTPESALRRLLA